MTSPRKRKEKEKRKRCRPAEASKDSPEPMRFRQHVLKKPLWFCPFLPISVNTAIYSTSGHPIFSTLHMCMLFSGKLLHIYNFLSLSFLSIFFFFFGFRFGVFFFFLGFGCWVILRDKKG